MIPSDLQAIPHWIVWRYEERDGKQTKVPYIATTNGGHAQTNNPSTWRPYADAVKTANNGGGYAGVGFVFTQTDIVGVDLDHCIQADNKLEPWADEIVTALDSYTEVTPSRTGLHILTRGHLPPGGRRNGGIEMYDASSPRYFTVTGEQLENTPDTINERTAQLADLHARVFVKPAASHPAITPAPCSDILTHARNAKNGATFSALYDQGDLSRYNGDQSAADAALCQMLAFWTQRDATEMDRLFRQSALMREKWDVRHSADGRTYGQMTVDHAIAHCTEVYNPPPPVSMASAPEPERESQPQINDEGLLEPLPAGMHALPEYGLCTETAAACPWLEAYIAHSLKWSPRAYEGFHEAVGVWLLSTVAARRVMYNDGGEKFTPLYITLASRSSLFAKSTTVEVGLDVLRAAGLEFLLGADDATPQKFVSDMTHKVPKDFYEQTPEYRQLIENRIAFAGQKGWFYEEFGQKVAAMLRDGGHMADFRGLLRKFDDCPPTYEYGTISRGTDMIQRPYLCLMANITPADLEKAASKGSALWSDGFLARFAMVSPPADYRRSRARFPNERRVAPGALVKPLRDWHNRLGSPAVFVPEQGAETQFCTVNATRYTEVAIPPAVSAARYDYLDALTDLIEQELVHNDLASSYVRLPEKALRMAVLFASFEGLAEVELAHFARAQQITERWRAGLHNLYNCIVNRVDDEERETLGAKIERQIMEAIGKLERAGEQPTARLIAMRIRGVSSSEVAQELQKLTRLGIVVVTRAESGRTDYYHTA